MAWLTGSVLEHVVVILRAPALPLPNATYFGNLTDGRVRRAGFLTFATIDGRSPESAEVFGRRRTEPPVSCSVAPETVPLILLSNVRVTVAGTYSQNGAICSETLAGISSFGQMKDLLMSP
ncbi:hypothetical protein [Paraburkholderia terrae]|uniref:hypothetical protein n=1 Tax=Paraburkholderia terrae TaxID=311230 RepID=UPI001E5E12B9|nr:hypothetical protein [Paraburkholderia terrae]